MASSSPLGRSHGHHRAHLVTVNGQVSRPPPGRTHCPLTEATKSRQDRLRSGVGVSGSGGGPGSWGADTDEAFEAAFEALTHRVDRLLHHAHICQTTGKSVRLTQALAGQGVSPLS